VVDGDGRTDVGVGSTGVGGSVGVGVPEGLGHDIGAAVGLGSPPPVGQSDGLGLSDGLWVGLWVGLVPGLCPTPGVGSLDGDGVSGWAGWPDDTRGHHRPWSPTRTPRHGSEQMRFRHPVTVW
jgi:hypothetical protein